MRPAVKFATVCVLLILAIAAMPVATDTAKTLPTRPGPPIAVPLAGGPPQAGIFLTYYGAHPLSSHCGYAYLLRVADADAFDLLGMWDVWRWFLDRSDAPPGTEIEWQGFPGVFHPVTGWTSPEEPFDGYATEGIFRRADQARQIGLQFEFRPAGDSAFVAAEILLVDADPPATLLVESYFCL